MKINVPHRKWRYSNRGMVLVVTAEYHRVMKKIPFDMLRSFTHRIVQYKKDELLRDGMIYDEIVIVTR